MRPAAEPVEAMVPAAVEEAPSHNAKLKDLAGSLAELTRRTDPEFAALADDLNALHTCAA